MTLAHDRAVERASTMPLTADRTPRQVAREVQDAALHAIDQRTAQRITRVDRDFDLFTATIERELVAARASAPRQRRITPLPDMIGMFAAGFGAISALGAGRVAPSTPISELPIVGPTVLICALIAVVAMVVGALVARREGAASSARAVMLWLVGIWSAVASIAMIVRFATEGVTAVAVAGLVATVVALIGAIILAIPAQRLAGAGAPVGLEARPKAGARERNELLSAGETAQDRAHDELAVLDESARSDFDEAYEAAVAAVLRRGILPSPSAKRLRALGWAAARYDIPGSGPRA
ncbi:hypothetical protein [Microbacterium allomyrinae]|uniref:Uncharacterized protein n=1 Tax=Microbacterium allomyrinae TaxID=2830666 RepID=A0A9X1LXM8_9MICO|nr:hypothetical protein [Microbacterium allomyrinae]MCC2033606.1 hypothetical protein [Microbacterium allomyrinae]